MKEQPIKSLPGIPMLVVLFALTGLLIWGFIAGRRRA